MIRKSVAFVFIVIIIIVSFNNIYCFIVSAIYASMGDFLRKIPPIGFFLVEIRGAGPCRGGVHTLHDCVR